MQGKLHVAAAFDFQASDDGKGCIPQHLILTVGQGLGWRDDDTVTGMYTNRIQIFHTADDDAVILAVSDNLILHFFPARYRLFQQNLPDGAFLDAQLAEMFQFFVVVSDAATCATKGIGRSDDHWISDFFYKGFALLHTGCNGAGRNGMSCRKHQFFKGFPIFRLVDAIFVDAKQFRAIFLENTFLIQRHGKIQTCLSAETRQHALRPFLCQNLFYRFFSNGLQIYFVCDALIGHNSRRIAVDQNGFNPFFADGFARLSSRIVKLRRLTDNNRT